MKTTLLIHGGAGGRILRGEDLRRHQDAIHAVLKDLYPRLERGGSALDLAVRAVEQLENNPLFNAGKGSAIQSDGHIRMSASLMDGARRRFAGCVNVEGVKNPIRLAQKLMSRPDRVLAGAGAQRFAREMGLSFASPFTPARRRAYELKKKGKTGTVGAVVLDRQGRLAAATSTGGKGFEYPGRVSDSPTCAGNFANRVCAVSATGTGESIVEFSAAAALCAQVEVGVPLAQATRKMLMEAKRAGAQFGFIALDRNGHWFADTATKRLTWGVATSAGIQLLRR